MLQLGDCLLRGSAQAHALAVPCSWFEGWLISLLRKPLETRGSLGSPFYSLQLPFAQYMSMLQAWKVTEVFFTLCDAPNSWGRSTPVGTRKGP